MRRALIHDVWAIKLPCDEWLQLDGSSGSRWSRAVFGNRFRAKVVRDRCAPSAVLVHVRVYLRVR